MTESLAVRAVIFDWAGTVVDYGSRAPMQAFVEVFKQFKIDITIEEARIPMGLPKWDHIQALGRLPRIAEAWRRAHGREFSNADIDAIYEVFVPMNAEVIPDYAELIPGALDTVRELRNRGLKIGSTTGYVHEIMDVLVPLAAKQGFAPDCMVCAGDLAAGRPTPLMMYRCFIDLNAWPAAACVKVDDTEPGIAEGLAAGTWTVGVATTGNGFGLSPQESAALSPEEFAQRRAKSAQELEAAGAHFVIDGVSDLLPVIEEINNRLSRGERPC
ncbi:MAG: phosphonoacetaldehyde hydrolase [Candidatus Competibacteraceae bacterium]|nr:phosphonoacetaldehyde hydrolase [Candidatus Competibacteraceae bacterium]